MKIEPIDFKNYKVPCWDEYFMRMVYLVASKSKDYYTKIGSVIVKDNRIISTGYNGMPERTNDNDESRQYRPNKYLYFSHAERNAIYNAAKYGISTQNTKLYVTCTPCSECCHAIIQSGIRTVLIHKQFDDIRNELSVKTNKWIGNTDVTIKLFKEAGIEMLKFNLLLNLDGYFDGKIIKI